MKLLRYLLLLLFGILFTTIITATVKGQTQTLYSLHVGASGDSNSVGNSGVQADIQTHIEDVASPASTYSFWVGDDLVNGAFIQFGYELNTPGTYCLYGEQIGANTNCFGSSDYIGSGDARWFWQYWPNSQSMDFYFEEGQVYSVGSDGSWRTYEIAPNVANGWNFILDGQIERSFNSYQVTTSKDAAYVVAEEVTASSASGNLGPVEFRNLEYLNDVGWQPVTSLTAISDCSTSNQLGVYPNCDISNPYGVSVNGSSWNIIAGSGQNEVLDGTVLWTSSPTLTLQVPSQVSITLDGVSQNPGQIQTTLPTGTHYVSVPSFVQLDNVTRLRFIEWLDWSNAAQRITDPNITITLTSNYSLSAVYATQYKLTLVSSIMIGSSAFSYTSWENWYDSGSTGNFTISNPSILMTFNGWYDEYGNLVTALQNGTILMDGPHILVAQWQPNYVVLGGGLVLIMIVLTVISKRRSKVKD